MHPTSARNIVEHRSPLSIELLWNGCLLGMNGVLAI
jgi:hypothetical protein